MKKYQEATKEIWKEEIKKHIMLYPDERIVAFSALNYNNKDNSNKNVLDIGCGSGRNLVPFLNLGFNCYGIDYNEECCYVTKEILGNRENLKGIYCKDIDDLDFEKEFFDVIVLYGVLFLNKYEHMKQYLFKIYKYLKKGGKILINFRSKEDDMNGCGERIASSTYIISDKFKVYAGSSYTFLSFEEAETLLLESHFKIESYEKLELWKNNLTQKHSWWIFSATK